MYTLRRIHREGQESNFYLGKNYSVLLKEKASKEEWDAISIRYWGKTYEDMLSEVIEDGAPHVSEVAERDCFGFVIAENGETFFLLPWQQNYIMTESGKTFSNLTYR